MFDKFNEECGVFGIFDHPEASNLTYLGLYALQHRGQESCGIVSSDGHRLHAHKSMGLVADVFRNETSFKKLPGQSAIGHVRYSTAGGNDLKNVQPIMVDYSRGSIAVAHNGNLVNAQKFAMSWSMRLDLLRPPWTPRSSSTCWPPPSSNSLVDRLTEALQPIKGAYCLLFLTETRMVAVRDPTASGRWLWANLTAPTWLPRKPAPWT